MWPIMRDAAARTWMSSFRRGIAAICGSSFRSMIAFLSAPAVAIVGSRSRCKSVCGAPALSRPSSCRLGRTQRQLPSWRGVAITSGVHALLGGCVAGASRADRSQPGAAARAAPTAASRARPARRTSRPCRDAARGEAEAAFVGGSPSCLDLGLLPAAEPRGLLARREPSDAAERERHRLPILQTLAPVRGQQLA
jgi:hypothetical protein